MRPSSSGPADPRLQDSSGLQAPASAPSAAPPNPLYKTETCKSWQAFKRCRFGNRCQFAHGDEEVRLEALLPGAAAGFQPDPVAAMQIRPLIRHPKYKTELCRSVACGQACIYGDRCKFIHPHDLPAMAGASPAGAINTAAPSAQLPGMASSDGSAAAVTAGPDRLTLERLAVQRLQETAPVSALQSQPTSSQYKQRVTVLPQAVHASQLPMHYGPFPRIPQTPPWCEHLLRAHSSSSPGAAELQSGGAEPWQRLLPSRHPEQALASLPQQGMPLPVQPPPSISQSMPDAFSTKSWTGLHPQARTAIQTSLHEPLMWADLKAAK